MVTKQLLFALLLPLLVSASPVVHTSPVGNDVCLDESSLPAVLTNIKQDAARTDSDSSSDKKNLPVFFFHGITGNTGHGANIEANLTAEGRPYVALSFCENENSIKTLNIQVPMAIAAVRDVVARDERFVDGYIFVAHSQGGLIARSVIEQMDDHKVTKFVSLAGVQNGVFNGPFDGESTKGVVDGFGAAVVPSRLFDFTKYSRDEYRRKMQLDWARRSKDPELQTSYSFANLARTPVRDVWLATNQYLPMINNVNICAWYDFHCHLEKLRRKNNFLKVKEAHFFVSPEDAMVAPWQSSQFGHYTEVNSLEEIESKFEDFTVVEMHDTVEYKDDTFGLRSLDERGALFRHTVPNVHHFCWLFDYENSINGDLCKFDFVYDEYVYQVIS